MIIYHVIVEIGWKNKMFCVCVHVLLIINAFARVFNQIVLHMTTLCQYFNVILLKLNLINNKMHKLHDLHV